MEKPFSFETERLVLRPSSEVDAPFLLELLNTPKWIKNIGDRKVYTLDDARNYLAERILPQLKRLGYSNYTMIRKSDGAKLGSCGLYDRDGLEGIDIGFALLPQYEKMGYAYEAAAKIKEVAISKFGIRKLSAITVQENKASQQLLEKLGLQYIKQIKIPNDEAVLLLYQLEVDGEAF